MTVAEIQALVDESDLDGWLLYDFRHTNRIAYRALGLDPEQVATRRWYFWIPRSGEPRKIVSAVEPTALDRLPGETTVYRTWQERELALRSVLSTCRRVAMEYSAGNAVPYLAYVDAGTVELIRSFGPEVVSSADLVQRVLACWSESQLQQHLEASRRLTEIAVVTLDEVRRAVSVGEAPTDWQTQQQMFEWLTRAGLVADHAPIVATNERASDPHYAPSALSARPIERGDLLLIDFWAKLAEPGAVYADYTWLAQVDDAPSPRASRLFAILAEARDRAITFVRQAAESGRSLRGFEVDRVARQVVGDAGYGEYFVHRTGHNIGEDVHGEGANIDDYEVHDDRVVLPHSCFSIEPGIYLPDLGLRTEVDVYHFGDHIQVTGGIQRELIALLSDRTVRSFFG